MSRVPVLHYGIPGTKLELIDILEAKAKVSTNVWEFFLWASAMQYIWRFDLKGEALKDIDKAIIYLGWLRQAVAGKK